MTTVAKPSCYTSVSLLYSYRSTS